MPGSFGFTALWRGPVDPRRAGDEVMKFIVPLLESHGYEMAERESDRLLFVRHRRPGWLAFVWLGLVALLAHGDDKIVIEMDQRDAYTLTIVSGIAPLALRRVFAELED